MSPIKLALQNLGNGGAAVGLMGGKARENLRQTTRQGRKLMARDENASVALGLDDIHHAPARKVPKIDSKRRRGLRSGAVLAVPTPVRRCQVKFSIAVEVPARHRVPQAGE